MGTAGRELPGPSGVVVALDPADSANHRATHALVFHGGFVRLTPANRDVRVALERAAHLGNRVCIVGHTAQGEQSKLSMHVSDVLFLFDFEDFARRFGIGW